ncbi:hypothetical protein AB0K08_13525 [Citricoccus sp. NPDC055426]|uniref:hypothetical protein n=1 Tax=Citricoccus sp. NPDC055426 TaxID=3155536 RepID=UPI00342D3744
MSNELFLVEPPTWIDPAPLLASNREQSWSFRLLNKKDVVLDEMDGVTACDLNLNVNAEIRGGGSLSYAGPPVDWMSHRIQPWITVKGGGQEVTWPLGVFIPSAPRRDFGDEDQPVSLELYDKGYLMTAQAATANTYAVPAGTVVTDRVRMLLVNSGNRCSVTDAPDTLRTSMTWPAGTSYQRIINDLLDSINYFALYVDAYGTFRADPYIRPQDRSPAFGFKDDAQGIYSPSFTHERDDFSVPNRVILLSQVEGEEPALVSVATDDDPNSQYSYEARGIRIVHTQEGVEATSQAKLDQIARRRLEELQRVTSTYQIQHLPVPLELNDTARFIRDAHGIRALTTIQTMKLSMGNALCETTLREVAA